MMPWFLGLCGLAVPYGSTRSTPTVDNGGMTVTYAIRPITPADDAAMAALIRRNLEDAGLDRPGTAYCDPQLDWLAEYYAGLERPGAYWIAVERVGSRHGRGSGDADGGGDDCDSVADNCGVSGHDTISVRTALSSAGSVSLHGRGRRIRASCRNCMLRRIGAGSDWGDDCWRRR